MDIIGILPNETAVMETTGKDTAIIGALIQRIADFGYRKILIGADADADKEHVQNSLQPFGGLGATVLSDAESVLHAIDFETAAKQADFVILHAFDADGDAAKTTLSELKTLQKPTCLLTRKAIDAKRMMRENAVLRGVIELDEAQPLQKQSFDDKVLPLIGKDVAKAQQV